MNEVCRDARPEDTPGQSLTLLNAVSLRSCKKSAAFLRSGDRDCRCCVFGPCPKRFNAGRSLLHIMRS
jgi:hypothetical protein